MGFVPFRHYKEVDKRLMKLNCPNPQDFYHDSLKNGEYGTVIGEDNASYFVRFDRYPNADIAILKGHVEFL